MILSPAFPIVNALGQNTQKFDLIVLLFTFAMGIVIIGLCKAACFPGGEAARLFTAPVGAATRRPHENRMRFSRFPQEKQNDRLAAMKFFEFRGRQVAAPTVYRCAENTPINGNLLFRM